MSRNGAGIYTLDPRYLVSEGDTILPSQHNPVLEDLQTDANTPRPIVAGGTGASTATTARTNLSVYSIADVDDGFTPKVATRTALKALDTATTKAVVLTEASRQKLFMWMTGDFTDSVAGDPSELAYIPADGIDPALGCWVAVTGAGASIVPVIQGGTGANDAATALDNLGGMASATYDPNGVAGDAFDMANMVEATDAKIMTAAERVKLAGVEAGADVTDATNVDAAGATMNTDTDVSGNSWVLDEDDMASDSATKVPTQQSVKAKIDNRVPARTVVEYGTITHDDTGDETSAFNDALAAVDYVVVPPGNYRADSLITIPPGKTLHTLNGSDIRRLSAHSVDTDPVIHVKGTRAALIGDGTITTENAHTEGIVVAGHRDDSASIDYNALYWKVHGVKLVGVQSASNIGLWVPNAQWTVGNTVANYFGSVRDIVIDAADIGVLLSEFSNAHEFQNVDFDDMITAAYELRGAQENRIFGGFLHSSTDGVIGIRLRNPTKGTGGGSLYNTFVGFTIEPGGSTSKGYEIESDCERNYLLVQNNAAGAVTVSSLRNTIISSGGNPYHPTVIATFAFDGTDTGSITPMTGSDYNFGTLTRVSAGVYDFTFSQAAANTTYQAVGSRIGAGSVDIRAILTTGFRIQVWNGGGTATEDTTRINITVTGHMA